jgi:hypothetical protein
MGKKYDIAGCGNPSAKYQVSEGPFQQQPAA